MADGKIKISELDEALQLSDNAEFPYTQDNGGVPTTFKAPANQIARKVAEGSTFTNLETTNKTLVGAINELSHLGNPILLGTTAPTSSQGANGNIYVQYTEGTGGDPDTVDSIYVKIDGAWCEISTGGGGGTTDYEDLSNKPQVNSVELVGNKSLDDLGIMPASLSKTASGSIVHITDGADNIPVKSLVSQIVAVESGNGQPKSPTNPYTISGFDSGVVSVYAKYHRIIASTLTPQTQSGITVTPFADGHFEISGTATANITLYFNIPTFTIFGEDTRTVNFNNDFASNDVSIGFIKDSTVIDSWSLNSLNRTYTNYNALANKECNVLSVTVSNGGSVSGSFKVEFLVTNSGNTYTFTFGQTVYGGHFDNKGNLVDTHGYGELDGTENYWSITQSSTETTVFRLSAFSSPAVENNQLSSHFIFNISALNPSPSRKNTFIQGSSGNLFVQVDNNIATTVEEWKTWLATQKANNTPVQICFPKKTPTTVQLTPTEVPTLLGENNIFSNCGDLEVEYYISNSDDIAGLIKSVGSGGHTIVDDSGTALTQRTNLQFNGAYSEDNSTDDTTEVNIVREMTKAEFDELTEEEKTGFINITDITSGNDDRFQPVIYSTDEQEIGVYTDGKPLYQKTIILPSAVTVQKETWTTVATVTDLDIDSLAYCFGNASTMAQIASVNAMIKTEGNDKVLQVFFVFAWAIRTVTIQYTKTTDTAGSGQWTPQGVPAHHYSENEQVVGTWIDGSTIYEKTIDIAQYSVTAEDTQFANLVAIANIDFLVSADIHKLPPNVGQLLRFNSSNGYIQVASKTTVNVSAFGNLPVTFRYTKSV